jgi:HEAT repeat protein
LAAISFAALVGCVRSVGDQLISDMRLAQPLPKAIVPPEELPSLPELEGALTSQIATDDSQRQTVDGWYLAVDAADQYLLPKAQYRWRHAALERWLERESPRSLQPALKSKEPYIAAVATIGLSRTDPAPHRRGLLKLVQDARHTPALRAAAIETLARDDSFETEAELRKLLDKFGPNAADECDTPLYVELLAGLARHIAIDQEPLYAQALTLNDPQVQLAVLSLYQATKTTQLPNEVIPLTSSSSAHVRRAALAALATAQHPDAVRLLRAATQDGDVQVRVAAIQCLGEVKHPEAVLALHDLAADNTERLREAAAGALVAQREWRAVERSARDPSFRVRSSVATALATHGSAERVVLARQLLTDQSAMVQSKMAASLAQWPLDLAGPLLIESLRSPNLLTRQSAAMALQTHWPAAKAFHPQEPNVKIRTAAVDELAKRWQEERPHSAEALAATASGPSLPSDQVHRLLQLYQTGDAQGRWLARRQLEDLGSEVVPAINELVATQRAALTEADYRDLLPAVDAGFAALEELRATEVTTRRAAARKLAQQAASEPLTVIAIERLSSIARAESDALVWQDVLRAATATPETVGHELALAALAHDEAEVRRRGCEYLEKCGDDRQATALLTLVDDRDPLVAHTAVIALGRCGPTASRERLYLLLTHPQTNMQIAAAKTLARWGDERGAAALERFALSNSAALRRQAIEAMGKLAQPQFIPTLVQALDDQPGVRLAALDALPQVAGEDVLAAHQPPPASAAQRAQLWRDWYAKRR